MFKVHVGFRGEESRWHRDSDSDSLSLSLPPGHRQLLIRSSGSDSGSEKRTLTTPRLLSLSLCRAWVTKVTGDV